MTSVPGFDPDRPAPFASPSAWRRFAVKTAATSCHTIWLNSLGNDGYGRFHDPDYGDEKLPATERSGIVRASRWIWWAHHGPIADGQNVLHLCDLPVCVRLDHLSLGTQSENLQMAAGRDRVARLAGGRRRRADRADQRTFADRSKAVRAAVRAALAEGILDPDDLADIVEDVIAVGDPLTAQVALFPLDAIPKNSTGTTTPRHSSAASEHSDR